MPLGAPRPRIGDHRRGRRLRDALAVASVAALSLVAACSGSDDGSTTAGTDGPSATTAPPLAVDHSERGPYEVGLMTADVDGTEVFVLYPAMVEDLDDESHVTSVSSDVAFPESFRDIAPDFFIQDLPTDHYAEAPASDEGPFPVVLHSHGFSGHPMYEVGHLEHTASWGYVVVAPSHPSRNLEASITGTATGEGDPDVADLAAALDAVRAKGADQDSPLFGAVDAERVAGEGHSAGGGAVARLALTADVLDTVIGQAPGAPVDVGSGPSSAEQTPAERAAALTEALATVEPPDLPVLLIAGERDGIIPLAAVQAQYDWLATPKQLVVVANAGHNPFLDICSPVQDQGGLIANAGELAEAFGDLLQLGEDGCLPGYLDAEAGYALIDHLTVAWLRWALDQGGSPAAFSPQILAALFPDATGPVESDL